MMRQLKSAGTCLPESHSPSGVGYIDVCGSGSGQNKLLTSELFLPAGDNSVLPQRERGDVRRSRCWAGMR